MNDHERVILEKMRIYAVQAIQFKGNMDFCEFSGDPKTISACVFNLSQIGELTGKLAKEFIDRTDHIPWHKMKGMRNKIVHDYEGIQLNIVWDVLNEFLPELIKNIDKINP